MQSFVKYDMISHLQLTLAINTSHLQLIHDIPLLWKACFQEVCLGGIIEGAIDSQGFTIHTFFKSFLGAELADASHLPAPDNTFFVGGPKVVVLASPGPCAYLRDRCMRILSILALACNIPSLSIYSERPAGTTAEQGIGPAPLTAATWGYGS